MLTPLIVLSVVAAGVGLIMLPAGSLGYGLLVVAVLAGTLARIAQAKEHQTEHMDTLRIQAEALQKLLTEPEASRGQWSRD